MDHESFFHGFFVVSFLAIIAYRLRQHVLAETHRGGFATSAEGKWLPLFRVCFAIPFLATMLLYLFRPSLLDWSAVVLPLWLRWGGIGLVVVAGALLVWIHRHLARNFSTTLRIKGDHTLVTSGPYHWVRHPMYTVLCLLLLGIFLLTANWFLGLVPLGFMVVLMIWRTPREEAQLKERFGADYVAYSRRTGRYLPRLRPSV